MRIAEIQKYLTDTATIEGWFFPVDAFLFGFLDAVQNEHAIRGNVFEIGVHHGKSALLLARMLQAGEQLGVCDVFGVQELNVDRSGEGSLPLFLHNLRSHTAAGEAAVRIHTKSSHLLTVEDTSNTCRMFHIDGGHRPEDVRSDLGTAVRALHREGVVILDDVFNASWPGVAEGFFEFMLSNDPPLVPLLIGGNKVYLCRAAAVGMYESGFSALQDIAEVVPFTFEAKSWFGRSVTTAVRHHWVDLDPVGAALAHLRGSAREEFMLRFKGQVKSI